MVGLLSISIWEKGNKEIKCKGVIEKYLIYWFTGTNVVELNNSVKYNDRTSSSE